MSSPLSTSHSHQQSTRIINIQQKNEKEEKQFINAFETNFFEGK